VRNRSDKGSDQKQEMFLDILCLFSVNYRFNQHLNLITIIMLSLSITIGKLKPHDSFIAYQQLQILI